MVNLTELLKGKKTNLNFTDGLCCVPLLPSLPPSTRNGDKNSWKLPVSLDEDVDSESKEKEPNGNDGRG